MLTLESIKNIERVVTGDNAIQHMTMCSIPNLTVRELINEIYLLRSKLKEIHKQSEIK